MTESKIRRSFLKHTPTGEIWAVDVESYEAGPVVVAALRCTRDVELTLGALPVLALETEAELLKIVQTMYDGREFFPWQPEQTNLQIMHRLHELHEDLADARTKVKMAQENLKKRKATESEVAEQIFALVGTIREDEPKLPFDGSTRVQSVAPAEQAIAEPAPVDSETVEGIEAMAAAVDAIAEVGEEGDEAAGFDPIDEDPGPDPMDVVEADRDLDDHGIGVD